MLVRSVVIYAAMLSLAGCGHMDRGPLVQETKTVDAGKVEIVDVHINLGAGEVEILPGSGKLLDADFEYDVPGLKPEVKYTESGLRGNLVVTQPGSRGMGGHNQWILRLRDDIPMDLSVKMGAGQGTLKLAGLDLRRLDISIGAGEIKLDLRGDWKRSCDVTVRGGVGSATVYLPRHVGLRAKASGGLGSIDVRGLEKDGARWINARYEDSPVRLNVDVSGGIGEIKLIADE